MISKMNVCDMMYMRQRCQNVPTDDCDERIGDAAGHHEQQLPQVSNHRSNLPLTLKQLKLDPAEETWARKPTPPPWVKVPQRMLVKASPENERLPRVCPRFILENRTRWNRIEQEWEPILNKLARTKRHCYKPSYCPFHRGYDM